MAENKATKEPNKPKRPPGAFFLFLEEFRKSWWAEVKGVAVLGRVGGEKWKSMSEAEKAPYEEKAAKRKADYLKLMDAFNKKQDSEQ